MKKNKKLIWTSILTAVGASLCCITPLLALISGVSGAASSFSWMEPFRPYLIAITLLVLGYAWYQQLKPKKEMACDCEEDNKKGFMQSRLFLGLVTVFALVMLAFPYYSEVFYPKQEMSVSASDTQEIILQIEGMTCESCQDHVNYQVGQLPGIIQVNTSYENGNTCVQFDPTKTNESQITQAINSTGYQVKK